MITLDSLEYLLVRTDASEMLRIYAHSPSLEPEEDIAKVYLATLRKASDERDSIHRMTAEYIKEPDANVRLVDTHHENSLGNVRAVRLAKRQFNFFAPAPAMAPAPQSPWNFGLPALMSGIAPWKSAPVPMSSSTSPVAAIKISTSSSVAAAAASTSAKATPSPPTQSTLPLSIRPSAPSVFGAAPLASSSKASASATIASSSSDSKLPQILIPTPRPAALLGRSTLSSDLRVVPNQYWGWYSSNPLPSLSPSLLQQIGPNTSLITDYPLYTNGTGTFQLTSDMAASLQPLQYQPGLSRDGGKGGALNGVKMFIFADTGISSPATSNSPGNFEGFVSNSIAIDVGAHGASGKGLAIADGVSEWANDAGGMRGFIPMTAGEQAYNAHNAGNGQRYAIWPESSIIPLTNSTAALFAPIVYTNVNYTSGNASFTLVGVTLSTISVSSIGGPVATRVAPLMWGATDVQWGCVGGIRSWGASGVGGTDGSVYVFGATLNGLLLARVAAADIANMAAYQYYTGNGTFSATPPTTGGTAYVAQGAFSTVDVFYSPKHATFIMVYQSYYADNAFYWRYLKANHAIVPRWLGGTDDDFVTNLWKSPWSTQTLLYNTPAPPAANSYTYGGGAFPGYYDAQDITVGGGRMLITWTQPTGKSCQAPCCARALLTCVVRRESWLC